MEKDLTIFEIDELGTPRPLGCIYFDKSGKMHTKLNSSSHPVLSGSEEFFDVPFFVDDMRPSGFIGKKIVQELNRATNKVSYKYPIIDTWSSKDVINYMSLNHDNKGNIAINYSPLDIENDVDKSDYINLATDTYVGKISRTLVDGEQPKFAVYNREKGHVIVKYSELNKSPELDRVCDLLRCENIANKVLKSHGIKSADTDIIEIENMVFLESKRFDRVGEKGRVPMLSMQALDMEYVGALGSWSDTAKGLFSQKIISLETLNDIVLLEEFGKAIGNNDMHHGNLSFTYSDKSDLIELCPLYDMFPTSLMPVKNTIPNKLNVLKKDAISSRAKEMAEDYWNHVYMDIPNLKGINL